MPFGLTRFPATFQRQMDRVTTLELGLNIFIYLDDIIVVTETFEEHSEWLNKVLDRIEEAGMTINAE